MRTVMFIIVMFDHQWHNYILSGNLLLKSQTQKL